MTFELTFIFGKFYSLAHMPIVNPPYTCTTGPVVYLGGGGSVLLGVACSDGIIFSQSVLLIICIKQRKLYKISYNGHFPSISLK